MITLFRELGIEIETALAIEQELNRLPERTRKVFLLRAQGYTQEHISVAVGSPRRTVRRDLDRCKNVPFVWPLLSKKRTYIGRGVVTSDYT